LNDGQKFKGAEKKKKKKKTKWNTYSSGNRNERNVKAPVKKRRKKPTEWMQSWAKAKTGKWKKLGSKVGDKEKKKKGRHRNPSNLKKSQQRVHQRGEEGR